MKHMMACFGGAILLVLAAATVQAQVTGSGTAGKVPIWTGTAGTSSTKLGNSVITQASGGIKVSSGATAMTGATSSGSASAVVGNATNTTGTGSGILGTTVSTTGFPSGVSGFALATSGSGIGVNGSSNSGKGVGVGGINRATTGNNGGAGVAGFAGATSGLVFGVIGAVDSSPVNTTAVGVQAGGFNAFRAFSQTCIPTCMPLAGTAGLFGTGTGGTILQGANTSTNAVVFDLDSSGNLTIAGKLTKGSGSFKIDHPLDPANKYLSHSFVESPDMMDIYNGNVTTDEHGWATIVLPDYFEALNRDFRYQLTSVGQFAQAIVATEIEINRFVIRTDKPRVKVSWQVTGIRQDAYANAHRIRVDEDKSPQERGHYLHPELFGATEKQAIGTVNYSMQPMEPASRLETSATTTP